MELDQLKQAWSEQTRKLDQVLNLNLQFIKTHQLEKTKSALTQFKIFLIFEMSIGLALLLATGSYLADHISVLTLSIPAAIFFASTLVAVIGAIRKLVLLGQIDYAGPIMAIQKKLKSVKLHFLQTIRLMILMLPLYMVYVILGLNLFFGWDLLAHGDRAFLWANFFFSLILIGPAVWIFRKLSLKNVDNPIVRLLVQGAGGKQMMAALEFLGALTDFENEVPRPVE